jgi:hypothetical protein
MNPKLQTQLELLREEMKNQPQPIRCRRCNRILTDVESIKKLIGPECEKKETEE